MAVLSGKRGYLRDDVRCLPGGICAAVASSFMMDLEHQFGRLMKRHSKNALKHVHDEIHRFSDDPARIRLYVAEHRLIYEAIVTGNADAAAFYVEQHIHRVQRDIAPQ